MLKIKKTLLILALITLTGCESEWMASRYLPTVSKAGKFPYGGWVVAELYGQDSLVPGNSVSGELISLRDHKIYILGPRQMFVIPDSSVYKATLYMYKKQPGVFAAITFIGVLPNVIAALAYPEYAAEFLVLGIAPLVTGTIFTMSEALSTRNQLIYPKRNTLEEFVKFSRFPQGIPLGQDIYQLKLPEVK
jgi:hypothetical protein